MKTPDELDRLLDDVLAADPPDEFREAALRTTLAALQRGRHRRSLARKTAWLAAPLLLASGLWYFQSAWRITPHEQNIVPESAPNSVAQAGSTPRIRPISDEELFALFPGRPLALIGPKGSQQLVFLDEEPSKP